MSRFSSVILFLFAAGCTIRMVTTERLDNANMLSNFDPNLPLRLQIREADSGRDSQVEIDWSSSSIYLEQPCRVNYRPFEFDFSGIVVVTGRLSNGMKYPVWIDSGMVTWPMLINDTLATKNEVRFMPSDTNIGNRICSLPSIKIGNLVLQNILCLYAPQHWEFQVLGLGVWQDKRIILGIETMAQFKYLLFDNTRKQVEFSYKQTFTPKNKDTWAQYPFSLKTFRPLGGRRIMVEIPIEGQICHMEFDTGGLGMAVSKNMWEKLRKRISEANTHKDTFSSRQYGVLSCLKASVETLTIGNIPIKNAVIVIIPQGNPYLSNTDTGQIGLSYFKNTAVALDFEHNTMWVKNLDKSGR